ncbi:hypothetical protein DU490_04730 [Halomonas sp. DQ26W]|nr:hypothetical protein DU490_04730 [Halomonas sp. DQ26W]
MELKSLPCRHYPQQTRKGRGATRRLLDFLLECRHPASIVTKSALILCDLSCSRMRSPPF